MRRQMHLDKIHIAYLEDVLSRSGILGSQLRMVLSQRLKGAFLFCDPLTRIGEFDTGGVCRKSESINNIVAFIVERMKRYADSALFFNECAKRGDPCLRGVSTAITCSDEVYHYLPAGSTGREIESCIVTAETGIALVGILFNMKTDSTIKGESFSAKDIEVYVQCATYLLVGVCDGETYLACRIRRRCRG